MQLRLGVKTIESGLQRVQAEEAPLENSVPRVRVRHREHFRGRLVELGRTDSQGRRRFMQEVQRVELVRVDAQALFLMREVVCDELPLSWEQGLERRQ